MRLTAHFTDEEFTRASSSPVSARAAGNLQAMANLAQRARDVLGVPLRVSSWYRNNADNAEAGGASNSQHLDGTAVDLVPIGMDSKEAASRLLAARKVGQFPAFGQIVVYDKDNHLHLSLGSKSEALVKSSSGYRVFVPSPVDATRVSTGGATSSDTLFWLALGVAFVAILAGLLK